MLVTHEKHTFFSLDRIWFSEIGSSNADIIRYTRLRSPKQNNWYTINDENTTVISEVDKNDDDLLRNFKKTVRYEIRRAVKEGIETKLFYGDSLNLDSKVVDDFRRAYLECAKGIKDYDLMSAYSERKVTGFINQKCVLLSTAFNDKIYLFHFYVFSNEDSVLLYSISNFREDRENEYIAGMANKLLHYVDLVFFRDHGVKRVDWGNLSNDCDFRGIDSFKLSFGGTIEKRYNSFVGNSIIGKLLVGAKKVLNRK